MTSDKSSTNINLDPDLSGAQAAEAELKNQIAAAQAAGKSCEELEAALAAVQSRFKELAGGAADYTGKLKGATAAVEEASEKQKGLREALGGLLAAFVNPLQAAAKAGLNLIQSARHDRASKDHAPTEAARCNLQTLKEQPAGRDEVAEARISAEKVAKGRSLRERRLVETQKAAETAAVNAIETNPLERARKLGEIEDKYPRQYPQSKIASDQNATGEKIRRDQKASTTRKNEAGSNLDRNTGEKPDAAPGTRKDNGEGPGNMKESYRVPATSIEKMGFVFGGAMSSGHAAITANNTTKMVAQLGTLIGVASGRKAAGDTTLSNSHAQ